ncbi:GNAT family N-acetyltransferase [Georgenia faecalis]|uniref:GNAT family N-acetyltransferase n=1 Tax=Georgenia faecalis TaxID=2483799 RepID=A0ABV9D5M4_9MICO|nr:GNAT family N-acetyltransferase [Georgenia faecalis]
MQPHLTLDRYRPEDRAALYSICLRTGAGGDDASADHDDPDLLGHLWLGPYLELEPDLAFVLRSAEPGAPAEPLGYVVATADTAAFEAACEERWWPPLREHYRAAPPRPGSPDAELVAMIEGGRRTDAPWFAAHPAHLHIDLLPEARGAGGGRALIAALTDALEARGVPGVHLGVSRANRGAVAFYGRVGLSVLAELPDTLIMGRALGRPGAPAHPGGAHAHAPAGAGGGAHAHAPAGAGAGAEDDGGGR